MKEFKMYQKIKFIYNNEPKIFWFSLFLLILVTCYLLALFAINTEFQLGDQYIKPVVSFLPAWNLLNERDIYLSLSTDKREFFTLPVYEIFSGYFSKITGIDLYFSGRLVNFVIFLSLLITLIKFNNILKSWILTFILIYVLVANQFFSLVLFSFHPDLFDYLLISLSIYYFYKSKFVICYIFMFLLAFIKAPYAFALLCYLPVEYYFNNNLYKEKIFHIIRKEKKKILLLLLLIIPAFSTEIYRNYVMGIDLFRFSIEGRGNFFRMDFFSVILENKLAAFKLYPSYDFSNYKNLFFVFLPFLPLIKRDIKLFIKTLLMYFIFIFNYLLFLKIYFIHFYSFLGMAFIVFILLVVNYKSLIIDLSNYFIKKTKLSKSKLNVIMLIFLAYYVFKIISLYYFTLDSNVENKVITYTKKFLPKDVKTLVASNTLQTFSKPGIATLERVHGFISTEEFRNDCNKYINEYDAIFLTLNQSCLADLLLASGEIFVDYKRNGVNILWTKDKRLEKKSIYYEIKINNFYRDDVIFDLSKAKEEFTHEIYAKDDLTIYRKDEKLFFIVKNCLSKNIVEKNIAVHVYYDFAINLKLLYKKSLFKFDVKDISIIANSMIRNDTCYAIKHLNDHENIKKINFGLYLHEE